MGEDGVEGKMGITSRVMVVGKGGGENGNNFK
jgi:hypothetical protein